MFIIETRTARSAYKMSLDPGGQEYAGSSHDEDRDLSCVSSLFFGRATRSQMLSLCFVRDETPGGARWILATRALHAATVRSDRRRH